jgi:hypothetical protein
MSLDIHHHIGNVDSYPIDSFGSSAPFSCAIDFELKLDDGTSNGAVNPHTYISLSSATVQPITIDISGTTNADWNSPNDETFMLLTTLTGSTTTEKLSFTLYLFRDCINVNLV